MKVKFLVIRFSSIGDIVLTSPVIRCLKEQVDGAEIHFVTKEKFSSIVEANPYIRKVYLFKDKLSDLLEELANEQFDYIIDLHQNFRSNRIKQKLNIPAFSFQKLNLQKWLLVNLKINRMPDKHVVDRYLSTVSVFDVKNDGEGLDFFIPNGKEYNISSLPVNFHKGYIAFCIAGTYYTKKLPVEKIIEICKQVDFPILLLGGKGEKSVGSKIEKKFSGKVINFCGETSLIESASIIQKAKVVLTNDTGLMHVAAAFRKRILSFWGNTVPELGMYPYQPHPSSEIIQVENLKCRPCSKLGFPTCPKNHFRCMNDIPLGKIKDWILKNYNQ